MIIRLRMIDSLQVVRLLVRPNLILEYDDLKVLFGAAHGLGTTIIVLAKVSVVVTWLALEIL